MPDYKTPGVYLEEIPHLPPSINSVGTAITAFIGYTQKATLKNTGDLINVPTHIRSILEYEQFFGKADVEKSIEVLIHGSLASAIKITASVKTPSRFLLYYSLQLFFANGGTDCYIVSIGDYGSPAIQPSALEFGLEKISTINEVTLIVFPDSINIADHIAYYDLQTKAIRQAATLQDRFVVMDVYRCHTNWNQDITLLRSSLNNPTNELKFAATYFPRLYTTIAFNYQDPASGTDDEKLVKVVSKKAGKTGTNLAALKKINNTYYIQAKTAIRNMPMLLPAAAAITGIYGKVDSTVGVWKAPANINIAEVANPELLISSTEQENLNVDPGTGKSVNVIRSFTGKGAAIVWGARTLAGNDNEWRYIPVRRFCNMISESVKNATEQFIFENNDSNTWIRIKSTISNYLTQQWRNGALMGTTTQQAFYVHLGLGETMTQQDLADGRLIVEIGLAAVRPAEFILLRFIHKMLQEP